ncbi:mRNA cleavage and polyadenylation specificity factor complex subunit [Truncatella angustata]|uniref:mRNA cleavage and polyadenylation specificity factor complex subunit n=1 Tax=Truncatella angustata TaxID=152316 RepID=A0A9P8UXQ2_9PEZI|nr:mRNA cleavage and polyadenylation specificity factor complex subunit [Truncatella angustata]KAH6660267.1 mRNA cleavage and polyadenylation specificity factor complex subunit [Truncatella angustata]
MAAANSNMSVPDQIRQLSDARKLVLGDVSYYGQVIQATLPIFGPSAHVELRRWGADFMAEAFATPAVPLSQKETLSLLILDTLKDLVEDPNQDLLVLRSVVQTSASVYPLAMRWIISNAYDTTTWKNMTAIKTRIFQLWENAPPTLRICCVKFAQRVILAQSPSINPEPRRGDPLDISLNMVPRDHSVLNVNAMEAEATGLLDRMLSVLQDGTSDVLVVDATLNTLSILIRMRPITSNKVVNAILQFNPLKLASTPMTPKTKVVVRSLEKTTRMLCMHLVRRDTKGVMAQRLQPYLERLMQARAEMQEGASRKRAISEVADGTEAKRQRTAPALPELQIGPLPPGPHSLADIFTFTKNEGLRNFDVALVPAPLAAKVSVNAIAKIDPSLFARAIQGVRDRLAELHRVAARPLDPQTTALDVEDDDDYEPDYYAAEDTEQILNKLDSEPSVQRGEMQKPAVLGTLALPTFRLPPPPALEPEQAVKVGQGTVTRVFGVMSTLEDPSTKKTKAGINRLAATTFDRESWITIITRLATRAAAGLDSISKDEDNGNVLSGISLSNSIRESLYVYVLEDFRKRIEIAVSWLCEEWYNDRVQQKATSDEDRNVLLNYDKWALRLIEGMIPYLHAQDKVLTRFLSEIPSLNTDILARVKTLCRDPSTVNLALTSLLYLVMMRPPVREIALDAVQDIWLEYDEARAMAGKYLTKWRPGFMEQQKQLLAPAGTPIGAGQAVAAT